MTPHLEQPDYCTQCTGTNLHGWLVRVVLHQFVQWSLHGTQGERVWTLDWL